MLLLLEILVLDINTPLRQVAEGKMVSEESYAFLKKSVLDSITNEMEMIAQSGHGLSSPVVLTWAAILIILVQDSHTGTRLASLVQDHEPLCGYKMIMDLPDVQQSTAKQLNGFIVYHAIALLLAAFGLEPTSMHENRTKILIDLLCMLFEQNSVRETFLFNLEDALSQPMLKFMDGCAAFFPAKPSHVLRILSALCSSHEGSMFAYLYLEKLHHLTLEHPRNGLSTLDFKDDTVVEAKLDIPVRGTRMMIPKGTVGKRLLENGILHAANGSDMDAEYIAWNITVDKDQVSLILLARLLSGLESMRKTALSSCSHLISDIEVILQFYESLCSTNDLMVLDVMNLQISEDGSTSVDMISILGTCISRLLTEAGKDYEGAASMHGLLSLCFKMCSYFAPYCPSRISNILVSGLGVSTVQLKLSRHTAQSEISLPLWDRLMSAWVDGKLRAYESVLSLFHLLVVFLQTSYGPKDTILLLSLNMTQHAIPYIACQSGSEEKWNLSAACLTIVRHSLMIEREEKYGELFGLEKEILKMIYPLLPPDAKKIQHDREHQAEAEAIEKCCVKWLRLMPVLLSASKSDNLMQVYSEEEFEAGRRFNEEYLFTSRDGVTPSPAATLLSYLSYPYFSSEDRAAVVRSMAHLLSYDSKVPVTAFLPKDGARLSLLESCMVIVNAVNAENPSGIESLFGAACDVLCMAVSYHPTLAVLLLPETLEENANKAPCSCTEHILKFAEKADILYSSHPRRLDKVLDVICAAITSKTLRNGVVSGILMNKSIWESFMKTLENASQNEVPSALESEQSLENAIHQLNIEMKIMDIFVAAVCSGLIPSETDQNPWSVVDAPIESHFTYLADKLLQRYCNGLGSIPLWIEMLKARQLAAISGVKALYYAFSNDGLRKTLAFEGNSLIAKLVSSAGLMEVGHHQDIDTLCSDLLEKTIVLNETQYSEPLISISNILLGPVLRRSPDSLGEDELSLEPDCLPKRIGSAWSKLIEECSGLEAQMSHLRNIMSLEQSLCECLRSLDSFFAVVFKRWPDLFPKEVELDALVKLLGLILQDQTEKEELLKRKQDIIMRTGTSVSNISLVYSKAAQVIHLDEKDFFNMVGAWADKELAFSGDGYSLCASILANLIAVGINISPRSYGETTDMRDACANLLPKLLVLSSHSSSKIACPASSLCMHLMNSRVTTDIWEDFVENFMVIETFNSIFDVLRASDNTSAIIHEQTLRMKSMLLLASQIVSSSRQGAESLVSKGICDALISICYWLSDSLPSHGLVRDKIPSSPKPSEDTVDLGGRYLDNGERFEGHEVWCNVLLLCSLLWTALPGHRKVQSLLLRISVIMSNRLIMALAPPSGENQFLTHAYVEEGRSAIVFISTMARFEGEWLVNQPDMMTRMRQATAKFLEFIADVNDTTLCAAVSNREIKQNAVVLLDNKLPHMLDLQVQDLNMIHSGLGARASEGCSKLTLFSFEVALETYSMVKYALDFQIRSSPEISEAEISLLRDTWVSGIVLESLVTRVASSLADILEEKSRILDSKSIRKAQIHSLVETCVTIIENGQGLMERMSHEIPPQLTQEIASICDKARMHDID